MSATTAFGQVAQALAAALLTAPAVAGGNVKANPVRPWPREVAQAVSLRLLQAQRVEGTNCGEVWALSMQAECEARATDAASLADPAMAVDSLLSQVAARIAAADLSACGVTERSVDDAVVWEVDAADTPVVLASLRFGFNVHVTDGLTVPAA